MEMLEKLLNSNVSLLLKDGRVVKGKLTGYDPYMNIVIDDAQESYGENLKRLGKIVLRGNGVISISQP
jgi:Small nuclear ribonucleoprotein, LSM family